MKNWGNWAHSNLKEVIDKARKDGNECVRIDQEHTDYRNDKQVQEWLNEMGLKFKTEMESTTIYLK